MRAFCNLRMVKKNLFYCDISMAKKQNFEFVACMSVFIFLFNSFHEMCFEPVECEI